MAYLYLVRRMRPTVIFFVLIPLILAGLWFGFSPFGAGGRFLPRWIRIALHITGGAFLVGGASYGVLDFAGSRISPQLHSVVFYGILLICGMGVGILFLLTVSGEYMKAVRDLPQSRERDRSNV